LTGSAPAIEVRSISKRFGRPGARQILALDSVSLEIRRGEIFGLIGANGAGKTTLLSCLMGFLRPESGDIRIDGKRPDDLATRAKTGYQPERLGFDGFQTGRRFLASHWRLAGGPRLGEREAVEKAAAEIGLDPPSLSRRLRTYSRGMLQRIGMAQALLRDPMFLFLDEPASGLDPTGIAVVRRRLNEARGRGATVVVNSHQLPEIARVCDRIAFLDHGRIARIEDLRGRESGLKVRIRVRSDETERALEILADLASEAGPAGEGVVRARLPNENAIAETARRLCAGGLSLYEVAPDAGLESLFERGDS
jgi:ABC-2 type transport system ATP-binding protein